MLVVDTGRESVFTDVLFIKSSHLIQETNSPDSWDFPVDLFEYVWGGVLNHYIQVLKIYIAFL